MQKPEGDRPPADHEMGAEESSAAGPWAWVTSYLDEKLAGVIHACLRHSASDSNREAHEDCIQNAAVLLWEIRRRLESLPVTDRDAYARVCIRRVVRDFLIGEGDWRFTTTECENAASHGPDWAQDHGAAAALEWSVLLQHSLEEQIERLDVQGALESLPPDDRRVLDLFYFHGLSHREIAERLGATSGQVKMQSHRAIIRLRKHLGGAPKSAERGEQP